MILDDNMSDNLWAEAIHPAVYLNNWSTTSEKNKTPYELWTGQQPYLAYLVPFQVGAPAGYNVPKIRQSKWQSSGEQCKVEGYEGTNQYWATPRG